jgi:hypothetical protein
MASRVSIYGRPSDPDVKRLRREMNAMFVEYDYLDPNRDKQAQARIHEWGNEVTKPVVEVLRQDDNGSVFLTNPDEPTLRQCLYSEGILSVTSYWL